MLFICSHLICMEQSPFSDAGPILSLLNFCVPGRRGRPVCGIRSYCPLPGRAPKKNLLHGHSHFAFSGWVGMALFTALVVLGDSTVHHKTLDLLTPYRAAVSGLGPGSLAFGMLLHASAHTPWATSGPPSHSPPCPCSSPTCLPGPGLEGHAPVRPCHYPVAQ
ncbi:MAG: hypothetical protein MZV63_72435 [Marinilabiliales bacterium]|nr:hypothetical protein [Marinilabiliales bacterium]